MHQGKGGRKKTTVREYSSESLMFRSIMGVIVIALGVVALLSVVTNMSGTVFSVTREIVQGLGGILCLGVPLFLMWSGVLLTFSARQSMPVRGIVLAFVFYLALLAIINLLSKVSTLPFLEHLVKYNQQLHPPLVQPQGFWGMLTASFTLCGSWNTFGGALGMLFAWVLWTYVGTTAGVVVLVLVCLCCAMFFSRFDLIGWGREMKERSDAKLEQREENRKQRAYQEQLRLQAEMEAQKPVPAYKRRGKKGQEDEEMKPAMAMPMGPGGYPMMPMNGMPMPFPMQMQQNQGMADSAMGYGKPMFPMQAQQPVQLYDEMIMPQTEDKPAWRLGGGGKKKSKAAPAEGYVPPMASMPPIQTAMTFTPSEVGEAAPEANTREGKKLTARMEEIRRRKAELAQDIFHGDSQPEAAENLQGRTIALNAGGQNVAMPAPASAKVAPPASEPAGRPERETAYRRPDPAQRPAFEQPPMSGVRLDKPDLKLPDTKKAAEALNPKPQVQPYAYPTLDLLNMKQTQPADTRAVDAENAARLEKTLESFGIPARVQRVTHGPAVTRFELGLVSSGINVKRIMSIADNIALEMAANGGVRIESPIPGTNLFGIEIPNKEVMSVSMGEVLLSPEMSSAKSALAVGLGKDIAGKPVICDLARMPHLLIAGQTGSGKSVCINTIINSILFRSSPEEVRMIMIDPKVVELQCYNVIPHLLIPVVSDPHKAAGALAWAVAEMLDRYHKMQSKNVRELSAYNAKLGPDEEKLPRIVIVIDELADLMLACKKEVEESIIRLAQLARAAGIHMLVATQRPTVDVITGLIKANIPSRIAFAVSSSIDSRTILDMNGAEKLLGRGDMFYFPTGASNPIRVQGCFLSDGEIERVVDYIGQRTPVDFDPNILEALEAENEPVNGLDDMGDGGVDDKLQEAIEMVISDGQASISMLQRRMKIGYARAGRLIDDMANRGVVSKAAGSKPREVLMTREEYDRIRDSLLK